MAAVSSHHTTSESNRNKNKRNDIGQENVRFPAKRETKHFLLHCPSYAWFQKLTFASCSRSTGATPGNRHARRVSENDGIPE